MAIIDVDERQVTLKIVYWGPPLAGKTTNLKKLYDMVHAGNRGRLMTLSGAGERTIFFDLLPLFFRVSGLSVRIKVYTVPGQVTHQMTRRVVLRGVDGVVFVADSDSQHRDGNLRAHRELIETLGAEQAGAAMITQFNKRDVLAPLPAHSFAEEPVLEAVAERGEGVMETFVAAAGASWASVETETKLRELFGVSQDQFRLALAEHLGLGPDALGVTSNPLAGPNRR